MMNSEVPIPNAATASANKGFRITSFSRTDWRSCSRMIQDNPDMKRLILALLLAPPLVAAQAPFCERLRTLTQDPTVASAHWGVQVTDLKGTPLCSINEARLFRPASNNKIFTTAAAMALLGPSRTFQTTVLGNFDPATGTVTGPLTLLGGGDANLDSHDLPYLSPAERARQAGRAQRAEGPGTAPPSNPTFFTDLEDLTAQLVAKGVRTITGDIVGDDGLFPYEPFAESWNVGDLTWGYGAPVSALTIADNQLRLTISASAAGQPVNVTLDQHGVEYFTVRNQAITGPAGAPSAVQVERLPGSHTLRVYGSLAADAHPDVEEIAIDDPALYAALAFRASLLARGVTVQGSGISRHRDQADATGLLSGLKDLSRELSFVSSGLTHGTCLVAPPPLTPSAQATLASHTSAPLAADVMLTNKVSQNLHAELLFHHLGQMQGCTGGSTLDSARMVRAFVIHAGVQPGDFILYDGSGLSDHDLVAPRALTRFLAFAATQPWFQQWKATLPEGGADGTLGARFKAFPPGTLSAKTGTLGESRALSGYLTTASGQALIFSVLVDDHLPTASGPPPDRTIMDRIVESIATAN